MCARHGSVPVVCLAAGAAHAEVVPQLGGGIAGFWWQTLNGRRDWLRPAPARLAADLPPNQLSCFPMLPFFGRIRDGMFLWRGQEIRLPHNLAGVPHAVHGHGWQRAWRLDDTDGCSATISYDHEPDSWPWRYRAVQHVALHEDGSLRIDLSVENRAGTDMPAGLGLHPYFPRRPGSRICARLPFVFHAGADLLPVRLAETDIPFQEGALVGTLDLDTVFFGWDGHATVDDIDITGGPSARFVTIVARPGRDFFTFEPTTQCSDAVNAPAGAWETGLVELAPGEALALTMRIAPRGGAVPC